MANETKLTWKLVFWILGVMVLMIASLLSLAYADFKNDLQKLDRDIEELAKQITAIDKKVDNRDTIDSLLVHGYRDHENRIRELERR